MTEGVEEGEDETEDILGSYTLSGGCDHVLRSTLKAFLVNAGGLRTARHVWTRRGVKLRCGRASALAPIGNVQSPGRRKRFNYIRCPGGVILLRRKTSARAWVSKQQKEFEPQNVLWQQLTPLAAS